MAWPLPHSVQLDDEPHTARVSCTSPQPAKPATTPRAARNPMRMQHIVMSRGGPLDDARRADARPAMRPIALSAASATSATTAIDAIVCRFYPLPMLSNNRYGAMRCAAIRTMAQAAQAAHDAIMCSFERCSIRIHHVDIACVLAKVTSCNVCNDAIVCGLLVSILCQITVMGHIVAPHFTPVCNRTSRNGSHHTSKTSSAPLAVRV